MRNFLTAADFARIIERDPKTIGNWIKKGLIPGVKRVGRFYQIPIKEVDVYKNSSTYPPKQWQK
jgi:predicted site-specific integrase-resolvase